MVQVTPLLKEWGVTMGEIKEGRTLTKATRGKGFVHGGPGSGTMHNELKALFLKAKNFDEFLGFLNQWADENFGGRENLPETLQVRR